MSLAVLVCLACCAIVAASFPAIHLARSDRAAELVAWAACVPGLLSFTVGLSVGLPSDLAG